MKLNFGVVGLLLCSGSFVCEAFVPSLETRSCNSLQSSDYCRSSTLLKSGSDQEKALREELETRNAEVKDEGKYAIADGSNLEVESEGDATSNAAINANTGTTAASQKPKKSTIDRLKQPRAYPLFLAEKGAEIVESVVDSFQKKSNSGESSPDFSGANIGGIGNAGKEKVVVLGTGWGAAAFLKEIDNTQYDVTVISPRNFFLFTPMLAGASVGTVEYRSITEPVREINPSANYLEAQAKEIDPRTGTVTCESVVCDGNSCDIEEFTVNYDRLVMGIGAQTNTFGIPGVREHCCYLKQVEDANRIRTAIVNCFERANLPHLSDEQREKDLTFAVIGAGPTGIEFAAELRDFVEQDGPKYYPNLLKYVRIKVIEASSTVLAPFDKSLQEEAIQQMNRAVEIKDEEVRKLLPERFKLTELLLDASVKEVTEQSIFLNDGREIPYGLSVWAAGNGPLPLTLQLIDELGSEQSEKQDVARGRVAVDPWMRAVGGQGKILAFGDCTCMSEAQLPATAQVASQQAEYLAKVMNKRYNLSPNPEDTTGGFLPPTKTSETQISTSDKIAAFACQTDEYAKPFQFLNLGILAYTGGGSALAQLTPAGPGRAPVKGKGKVGNALWRSVYLSKQVSWRNRVLVLNDWIKKQLFGRDITRL